MQFQCNCVVSSSGFDDQIHSSSQPYRPSCCTLNIAQHMVVHYSNFIFIICMTSSSEMITYCRRCVDHITYAYVIVSIGPIICIYHVFFDVRSWFIKSSVDPVNDRNCLDCGVTYTYPFVIIYLVCLSDSQMLNFDNYHDITYSTDFELSSQLGLFIWHDGLKCFRDGSLKYRLKWN